MSDERVFVGLDIGTTKIAAVVARLDEYNTLNIAGVGTSPSHGLRRGVIINIEKYPRQDSWRDIFGLVGSNEDFI